MRVSNNQILQSSLVAMQEQGSDVLKYQQQIASGNRFSKASEGVVELARGISIQFEQKRHEMLKSNQNIVQSRMDTGYVQLDTMSSLMFNLKEMVGRASFPGMDETSLKALYREALVTYNSLEDAANATDSSGRRYVALDKPPNVEIEPGVSLPSEVWFADLQTQVSYAKTFVDGLKDLADNVKKPYVPGDGSSFDTAIPNFNTAIDRVLAVRTQTGSASAQIDIARSSLEGKGIQLDSARARLLETDIADASTKLVRAQTLLQAAQSIFSRLESSNLFQRLG